MRKVLNTVPVRKPNSQDFIRVHSGETYRLPLAVIELKDDREIYLVPPPVATQLPGECIMVTLYLAINRQGVLFLWPLGRAVAGDIRGSRRSRPIGAGQNFDLDHPAGRAGDYYRQRRAGRSDRDDHRRPRPRRYVYVLGHQVLWGSVLDDDLSAESTRCCASAGGTPPGGL